MTGREAAKIELAARAENGARLSTLYIASVFLALFLHVPAMMLFFGYGRSALFILWILLIEGTRLAVFVILVLLRRQPDAVLALREYSISPRLFFPAAVLFFVYAGAPHGIYVMVVVFWLLMELRCRVASNRLDPAVALRQLRRTGALSEAPEGWSYRLDNGLADLLDKDSKGRSFMQSQLIWVGLPFAIIAPGLFLYSMQLGDNFELRAVIAGVFCLVIGWLTMPALVGARISRNALDHLGTQGKAAFSGKSAKTGVSQ